MTDIEKYSDEELINYALDYADDNPDFDPTFVESLQEYLDKYDYAELSFGQRRALENIVVNFEMIP